jgi:hypothetical protein
MNSCLRIIENRYPIFGTSHTVGVVHDVAMFERVRQFRIFSVRELCQFVFQPVAHDCNDTVCKMCKLQGQEEELYRHICKKYGERPRLPGYRFDLVQSKSQSVHVST